MRKLFVKRSFYRSLLENMEKHDINEEKKLKIALVWERQIRLSIPDNMFGTYVVYKHLHRSFNTATENRTCLYCYFCLRERDKIILLFQASLGGCCNVIVKF